MVEIPGVQGLGELTSTTIDYGYDALARLTAADYDNGQYFHYEYDANGNRTAEVTGVGRVASVYDLSNRLTSVGATSYTWDDNGNLTGDGTSSYEYNHVNRLSKVTQNSTITNYAYNGVGDRLVENSTQFVMDLTGRLTQVLQDGTNTYLYSNGRIGQTTTSDSAYFLGDALGSVRQLTGLDGVVTLAKQYQPYGEVMSGSGNGVTSYGFTGEWNSSSNNLLYLRARFYGFSAGRFLTRDSWQGDYEKPASFNKWLYGLGNPVNRTDPSGLYSIWPELSEYFVSVDDDWPAGHRQELISAVSDISSRLMLAYNNDHLPWIWAVYDEYKRCDIEAMMYKDDEAGKVFSQVYRTTTTNPLLIEWDTQCTDCRPPICADTNYANDPAHQRECTPGGGFTHDSHNIEFASLSEPGGNRTTGMAFTDARNNIVHELGHAFASRLLRYTTGPRTVLGTNDYLYLRDEQGFHSSPESARLTWRQHPGDVGTSEIFADMFLGWTYDTWADDIYGKERADFMSLNMHLWISMAMYW